MANVHYVRGLKCRADFPVQPSPTGMKGNLALCMGVGTSAAPEVSSTASAKFFSSYLQNSATSGTAVGTYMKLTVSGIAGSCVVARYYAYANVAAASVQGAQITGEIGVSGTISGLCVGCRSQLSLPDDHAAFTQGTYAGGQSEIYFNGDNSSTTDISGAAAHSIHRFIVDGDTTARAKVQFAFEFVNIATGTGTHMVKTDMHTGTPTDGLKIRINGSTYYISLVSA